ncbi:MAG: hypothetical protein NZ992_00665 [Candidatus Korarchaeum sp.]|nr:hypothetical protein [Candidatus Korarchaeum sp.]MDW8035508.1 hypothetical protein [Candidatus Korarchaeum sp.]
MWKDRNIASLLCPLSASHQGGATTCALERCVFFDTQRKGCIIALALASIYTPTVLLFSEVEEE